MKVQLCLSVLLNVLIYYTSATSTCSPENGPGDAEYHSHPTDCSKFITCVWGSLIEQQCPSGTYWNDAIKACDFTENVNCERKPASSTPPATSIAEKCPDVFDPSHEVFLPHADCSKFYICTQQGPVEHSCPSGLHWNQNANVCDWPQVAGCSAGTGSLQTTTPPSYSTTTVSDEALPVGKCPEEYDPNDEVFLPHADCTKYYHCTWNGQPVEKSCPPGLHWNANANRCEWPVQAGCRATFSLDLEPAVLKHEGYASSTEVL